jgi:hypothetical protein
MLLAKLSSETRMHSDDPISSPAFATKTNLDPDATQRCLRAPQPAGQRTGQVRGLDVAHLAALPGAIVMAAKPGVPRAGRTAPTSKGPPDMFDVFVSHGSPQRCGQHI